MTTTEIVEVPFHGDVLAAARIDGEVLVVVKRVCESLALHHRAQLAKLKTQPWSGVRMISTPDLRGRSQRIACVPLKVLPMWLATIEASRVAPHARAKIERYQLEAADALYAYFFGGAQAARASVVRDQLGDFVTRAEFGLVAEKLERVNHNVELLMRKVTFGGRISVDDLCGVKALAARIARIETDGELWRRRSTASLDVYCRLREVIGYGGKNEPLEDMPIGVVPKAYTYLRTRIDEAERRVALGKQRKLFD
jgi:hypothetical protein